MSVSSLDKVFISSSVNVGTVRPRATVVFKPKKKHSVARNPRILNN